MQKILQQMREEIEALEHRIIALEREVAELKGISPDRKYQIREIARRFNAGDKSALREWNKNKN